MGLISSRDIHGLSENLTKYDSWLGFIPTVDPITLKKEGKPFGIAGLGLLDVGKHYIPVAILHWRNIGLD